MATWVKFDGSEEHKDLIIDNSDNVHIKHKDNNDIDSFLICEPHPHRDMIIEWANTGKPVYYRTSEGIWELIKCPNWFEGNEYSFDPPKEKIKYRVALMEEGTMTADSEKDEMDLKKSNNFVKWLTDWQEVEV
jgi:hypothetical protein